MVEAPASAAPESSHGRAGVLLARGWLWAALILFVGATVLALWQPPRPVPPNRQAQAFSFFAPIERNPHQRLPFINSDLNQVVFNADGQRGWAVGTGDVILATTDGGQTWAPQKIGVTREPRAGGLVLPNLTALNFLADGRQGWAVGSSGLILATKDGGKTWAPQASGTQASLNSVSFHSDGQRGWAVGDGGVIVATTDGGQTWAPQRSGTLEWLNAVSFNIDGQRGWAVGGYGAIVATTDGGKTWAPQQSGTRATLRSISLNADGQRGWAVGEGGAIVVTMDGGRTWGPQTSGTRSPLFSVTLLADGQRGWAAGDDGLIVVTTDGGRTWAQQSSGTQTPFRSVSVAADGQRGWAAGEGGAILATADGGKTWWPQTRGTEAWLSSLAVGADGRRGWVVGEGGAILATTDGGASWLPQISGTRAWLNAVSFHADSLRGWAVGEGGVILATTDGGATWSAQTSGTRAKLFSVSFTGDGQRGWVVGAGGAILATEDGGKYWAPQASGTAVTLESVNLHADGLRGWAVGRDGVIVATTDGGKSWALQTSGTLAWLNAVSFHADGLRGWAVGQFGSILTTVDGGKTWMARSKGMGPNLYSVHVTSDGLRGWAVGADGSILATVDGGQSWSPRTSGTMAHLFSVSFAANGSSGWAAGQRGTILATSDGGETWRPAETYARYPPPWYWLVVFLCAWWLWLAWAQRGRAGSDSAVAGMAASDAAVANFADDKLDFAGLARGISRYLRNPETTPPLTLAITGDWGSGKSSLMQLVCADLRRFGHRPIWFNAWHHQKQEHLFAALLGEVRAQVAPPLLTPAGVLFRLRLLWCRSRRHFIASALIVGLVSLLLSYGLMQGGSLPASLPELLARLRQLLGGDTEALDGFLSKLAALITAVWALLKGATVSGANPAVLLAETHKAMSLKQAAAQNDFRAQFSRDFSEVAAALPYHMVIVIDDLDRCGPAAVLDVMEAVNYLTSSGACFVIFGMATERVQAALGLAFKDIATEMVEEALAPGKGTPAGSDEHAREKRRQYAQDYLQKLINIEIKVPRRRAKLDALLGAEVDLRENPLAAALSGLLQPWPAYALAGVVGVGVWLGTVLPQNAAVPPPPAAAQSAPQANQSDVPAPVPLEAVEKPKAQGGAAIGPVVMQGQANPAYLSLAAVALGLLPLLAVAALIAWIALRRAVNQTKDSPAFCAALNIWTPLVAEKRATPRAVKRFGNRIRYFAMLQQGIARDETALDVLWARATDFWRGLRKPQPERTAPLAAPRPTIDPETGDAALDDAQLAAMGAIYEVWGPRWKAALADDWSDFFASPSGSDAEAQQARIASQRQEAIVKHKAKFGAAWPPGPEECAVFERLLEGIRIEGEPRTLARGARNTAAPAGMVAEGEGSESIVFENDDGITFTPERESAAPGPPAKEKSPQAPKPARKKAAQKRSAPPRAESAEPEGGPDHLA